MHFTVVSHAWLRLLLQDLTRIKNQLKGINMAAITQSQIDTVTEELTTVDGTINSINTTAGEIATEVAALQASNPSVDFTGLTAIATKLGTDATTLATSVGNIQTALVPPTPAAPAAS